MVIETNLFKIEYRLLLNDGSFQETNTYVTAINKEIAVNKLVFYLTKDYSFDKIELFEIEQFQYNVIT